MSLQLLPHTLALQAKLETTGYLVGLNAAPAGAAPYYVLYQLEAVDPDGSLADPDADWLLPYQVTSVGVGPEQAQGLSDLARATLTGTPLTVAGRSIWRVSVEGVGLADRDDRVQPPLHFVADTLGVQTTPG